MITFVRKRMSRINIHIHHTLILLISLVLVAVGTGQTFLGCYKKDNGLERIKRVHDLNIRNCVGACEEDNKAYALLAVVECFCSNTKNERDVEENAKCSPCPRFDNETCGGYSAVAYYKTSVEGEITYL